LALYQHLRGGPYNVLRDASSQWSADTYENGETVRLESVELSLEVGALYHDAPPRTQG
jgi:hypothetical protein